MSVVNFLLIVMTAIGLYLCGHSAKAIYLHLQGRPLMRVDERPIPFVIWLAIFFFGLMAITGSLPGLLGQPMWFLDKAFSVISNVL